jgi:hypothetical protein
MLLYVSILALVAANVLMIGAFLAMRHERDRFAAELRELKREALHQAVLATARREAIMKLVDGRTRRN